MSVHFNYSRIVLALLSLIVAIPVVSDAQVANNMNMLSNWDNNALPSSSGVVYNDVWGYVDGNGREYAILGSIAGTHIIDITNPGNPVQVVYEAGGSSSSIWRDYKTYQNYLYAVSDQGAGSSLQIFDLSNLPVSVTKVYDSQALFSTAHNIFINEATARLYVAGANTQMGGLLIFDLSNPAAPAQLGSVPMSGLFLGGYVHDLFVKNDTVYVFQGNLGMGFYDFSGTNLGTWSQIGQLTSYPEQGYSHSGWTTGDQNYLIHADETHNTGLKITDVSNPSSPNVLTTFRSTLLAPAYTNSIVHNPFVMGNKVYVAYYHDGIQIFDINNPSSPTLIAGYDTHPQNVDYTGYDGAWGVYPYLPSGNILASDTQNGLFVLSEVSLPVELTEFVAERDANTVFLNWVTESEVNNRKFVVERSSDTKEWSGVLEVAAAGNSQQREVYNAVDENPLPGNSWYRLRQVDNDGTTNFSEIVLVSGGPDFKLNAVYPVPANRGQDIRINFSQYSKASVNITLRDLMGRTLATLNQEFGGGIHDVALSTENCIPGTYLVEILTDAGKEFTKITIQ